MRNPTDFPKEIHLKILNLFLSSNDWSHRRLQSEILGLEANARGGGFVAMSILHTYGIKKEHKGIFTKVTEIDGLKGLLKTLETNSSGIDIALKLFQGKLSASSLPDLEVSKRFAVAPTDRTWFDFQRERFKENDIELVNFWTPTPWGIKGLEIGDLFLFKVKGTNSIGGYGYFKAYREMSVSDAWDEYGEGNGFSTVTAFKGVLEKIVKRQNTELGNKIGCIELTSPVFYEESEFWAPESKGIDFSKEIVKLKYFDQALDISDDLGAEVTKSFEMVSEFGKKKGNVSRTIREGQAEFRRMIKRAYQNKCAISGESCSEVLEAAHLQPYFNTSSNHVQNGVCLRADIHKLFDSHLISIDIDLKVLVSEKLRNTSYYQFNGRNITLPVDPNKYPSKEALILRLESFRKKRLEKC